MEFIFENPFILIILIGIISSIFKKNKEENKSQRGRPKPFVESIPIPEVDVALERNRDNKATRKPKSNEKIEENMAVLSDPKQETLEKPAQRKTINRLRDTRPQQEKEQALPVEENSLVNAVIWSEILGPPRSKKRHRTMNRHF